MKKNSKLLEFSNSIPVLLSIYLIVQIYGVFLKLKFWVKYNNLLEIVLGVFREICEILYIPLWGITVYFSILFCEYWLRKRK